MPYHIDDANPGCNGYAVVKDDDGKVMGCHETRADAMAQMAALYANEPTMRSAIEKMMLVGAVKALGPEVDGFEGWASTSSLDRQGDVVEPSAFARSLPAFLANGLIYWQHAHAFDPLAKPIGKATDARIADSGLYLKARWASTPDAQEVRGLVVDGIVNSLSVGFNPVQMHRDSALGFNVITDLDLLEVSICAMPANTEARITSAKFYLAGVALAGDPAFVRRRRIITTLR